jgi:hypothetical protein
MKRWIISALIVMATTGPTRAADDLSTARDLYASAAYEEALATLNRMRAAGTAPRMRCCRAVSRVLSARARPAVEAQSAIETLVVADPL